MNDKKETEHQKKTLSFDNQQHFSKSEMQAMQKLSIKLFEKWELTDQQITNLLGEGISIVTYKQWKKSIFNSLNIDEATRLSLLTGIHKSLREVFNDPQRSYSWIKRPNEAFQSMSALDGMLQGKIFIPYFHHACPMGV